MLPVLLCTGCDRDDSESASTPSRIPDSGDAGSSGESRSPSDTVSPLHLDEVAERYGLTFMYRNGAGGDNRSILLSLGGGVGIIDYDHDGRQDIVLPGGGEFRPARQITGHPTALFRNTGDTSKRFYDVHDAARVAPSRYYSHGVTVSDIDNDGFRDFLITGYGGLSLYHNLGDGTFEEIAAASGLTDDQWSSSAAFGDFNRDGAVDLYVAHYVDWSFDNDPDCPGKEPGQREICPPRQFTGLTDIFYLSNGDGTFRDASREWGLVPEGKGLGVVLGDLDVDGDLDAYVANDTVPNFLYRNTGDSFEEAGLISGTSLGAQGTAFGSMGVDLGDYDRDGLPDIWVVNYEAEGFEMYHNEGNCFFLPVGRPLGVTAAAGLFVGWGTAFADFDRDGDLDMFVSNGHVIMYPSNAPLKQLPVLFENRKGQRFVDVASTAGDYLKEPHMGRGLALTDFDDDGDSDICISRTNEPVALLENTTATSHHWIGIRPVGRISSRDPVGARITVELADGRQLTDQFKGGSSYASSGDPRLLFGLGNETSVTRVTIYWPSGADTQLASPDIDRVHTVIEELP